MSRADRVGIYAPYDWDETTYAAIRLMQLFSELQREVSYRAYGKGIPKGRSLHARWDNEVSWQRRYRKGWVAQQQFMIWFDVHSELLGHAKRHGVTNILVPMLHRLEFHRLKELRQFDWIACPSRFVLELLGAAGLENKAGVRWDSAIPEAPVRESPLGGDGQMRALFLPEWPLTDEWGLMLAYTIRTLLDAEEDVEVTLLQLRQWSKVVNKAMRDLAARHASRFSVLHKPTWHLLSDAYRSHDWAVYLPEKVNLGIRLLEAVAAGLPVVALDSPPVKELFTPRKHGLLIPCEYRKDVLGRCTAIPNSHDMMEGVHRTLGDTENWYRYVAADRREDRLQRAAAFKEIWSCLLAPF
jgi:hypothetical protein